ncbi:hypothetical protein HWV62_9537 [Athelia sp. TMB]|nr:hypothetical protein HWV62_9537 [Athelia sp. TMB]
MHFTSAFWTLNLFITAICAAPTHRSLTAISLETVGLFPNGTWLENAAVRSNGQLLVTLLSSPQVYQVDPFISQQPQLVQTIPDAEGLLGIGEVEEDVFAVVAGNLSLATVVSTVGSYSIWKVDVHDSQNPTSSKVVDIPAAQFLNGLAVLDTNGSVLVSDSGAGVVYRVDTNTGEYQIVLEDPLMKPAAGGVQLGINGIQIQNGYLYFTSSTQGLFARVAIHPNGTAAGSIEVVASLGGFGDDFALDRAGDAYIGTNPDDTLIKVTPAGEVTLIAGSINSTALAGATSTHFGRTAADESILYVTTSGRFTDAAGEQTFIPGEVIAVRGLQYWLVSDFFLRFTKSD